MRRAVMATMFGLCAHLAHAACLPPSGAPTFEATASPLSDPGWLAREQAVEGIAAQADLSKVRLLFLGDSITEAWAPPVFNHFFDPATSLNLGVRGAGTQSLLYLLDRLPLGSRLRPDVVVLLIGTNNLWPNANLTNVTGGIAAALAQLQSRLPTTKIVLVDLLPRGAVASSPERAQVAEVNRQLAACAGPKVVITDPGRLLPERNGELSKDISFDALHLSWLGYAIYGAALAPAVNRALAE